MSNSTGKDLSLGSDSPFERIKRWDSNGVEFWSGRELMPVLGYASWQKVSALYQEVYSSLSLENPSQLDMVPTTIEVPIGSGALRVVEDWQLSAIAVERVLRRAAAYKTEAARALKKRNREHLRIEIEVGAVLYDFCEQAGLSIQHQKSIDKYIFDYCIGDHLLIEVDEMRHRSDGGQVKRDRVKDVVAAQYGYKLLRLSVPIENAARLCGDIMRRLGAQSEHIPSAAKQAGVITSQDFAVFQNHGYKGLYNGLTADGIHKRKRLKKSQNILDHMGATELAANLFRSTQAEEKLRRDNVQGKQNANQVHYQAGVVVRRAIAELGGTMPEDLPSAESIKKLETAEKKRLAGKTKRKKGDTTES